MTDIRVLDDIDTARQGHRRAGDAVPAEMTAYSIVTEFERRVAAFTGAPYAVAVDSCTNALFLCLKWHGTRNRWYLNGVLVRLPSRTYCSVPMAVRQAGARVKFHDLQWVGMYDLYPYYIYDAAKRFRRGMYTIAHSSSYMCLSFHFKKNLPIGRGGMILHDNPAADRWFRAARHNGRPDGDDSRIPVMEGWDMWMTPEQAARGMVLMDAMPRNGFPDQPIEDYPDLRTMEVFK
jgi:dTDP-4-amino-4,6-dideoxygalactose transaminase